MNLRSTVKQLVVGSLCLLLLALFGLPRSVQADNCTLNCDAQKSQTEAYLSCITAKKTCLEQKLAGIRQQQSTLTNEINLINGKINLQQVKIKQTLAEIAQLEAEVTNLAQQIENLNYSLDRLTEMLLSRIQARYKRSRFSPWTVLISSDSLRSLFLKQRYLDEAGKQTAGLMKRAETQRILYDQQKQRKQQAQDELQAKQLELEDQRRELASQKAAQQRVLDQTKQSEKSYQQQLAAVTAEFQAIQAIISGGGSEVSSGPVKTGDRIATIIYGPSCNSSGTHLHFMVTKNQVSQNPFNYLKPGMSINNCSGSSCGSSDGDPANPSGSWDWPIFGPVQLLQGYGSTWATRHTWVSRIYTSHNGIDIRGSGYVVKAAADGTLYRGSFTGSGGCRLRYVKIEHGDGLVSWYLHVNY